MTITTAGINTNDGRNYFYQKWQNDDVLSLIVKFTKSNNDTYCLCVLATREFGTLLHWCFQKLNFRK